MNQRLQMFVLAQLGITIAAKSFHLSGARFSGAAFSGVLAAQIVLLVVYLGFGTSRLSQRLALGAVGLVVISGFALTLRSASVAEVLSVLLQLTVLSFVLMRLRCKKGLVLSNSASGVVSENLFRVSLRQLLGLTLGVAACLAITRSINADGGVGNEVILWLILLTTSLLAAPPPLIAVIASLSDKTNVQNSIFPISSILILAAALAGFGYSQINSWRLAEKWFTMIVVESSWICVSLLVLRRLGYRLNRSTSA